MSRRHLRIAWTGVLVCTGFLVTGILLLVAGILEWQVGSASLNWPMTQAWVTRSQQVKRFPVPRRSGGTFAFYEREISVRYSINGANYDSDFALPIDGSSTLTLDHSRGVGAPAAATEHITVYYNPVNPRQVTLHPGDQVTAVYGIAFGATLTAIFSLLIYRLASWLPKPGAKLRAIEGL